MQYKKTETAIPLSLIEATQLISKAKQLIYRYHRERDHDPEIIFPSIFEIEHSLNTASHHIASIVSIEFEDKYFYHSIS
jgi:hypothetical protein